jgi:hypothetical protein
MAKAVIELLDPGKRDEVRRDQAAVKATLGGPGASRRAAEEILQVVHHG